MQGFLDEVKKLAEQVSTQAGCRLYDIEFASAPGGRVLRVYIDKANVEGGASIDDCTLVSRGLNEILDADEEIIPGGNYYLEVSTPGLERTLSEPWHFEAAIGTKISVKTFAALLEFNPDVPALGKAKTVEGKLSSFDEKELHILWNDATVIVPRDQVTKAHVVYVFEEPTKKNKPNKMGGHPRTNKSQGAAKK